MIIRAVCYSYSQSSRKVESSHRHRTQMWVSDHNLSEECVYLNWKVRKITGISTISKHSCLCLFSIYLHPWLIFHYSYKTIETNIKPLKCSIRVILRQGRGYQQSHHNARGVSGDCRKELQAGQKFPSITSAF